MPLRALFLVINKMLLMANTILLDYEFGKIRFFMVMVK